MKKILSNSKIQVILSLIILVFSYLVNYFQGYFGFWIPFIILILFLLIITLIYYVITIPLFSFFSEQNHFENILSLEELKEYESTGDFKEIWIISSNLDMASSLDHFIPIIQKNLKRNIKYRFFISNSNLAKEIAKNILLSQKDNLRKRLSFYYLDRINDSLFVNEEIDYDLFLNKDPVYNNGYIGITISNVRNYVLMPKKLFINLKTSLENAQEINLLAND